MPQANKGNLVVPAVSIKMDRGVIGPVPPSPSGAWRFEFLSPFLLQPPVLWADVESPWDPDEPNTNGQFITFNEAASLLTSSTHVDWVSNLEVEIPGYSDDEVDYEAVTIFQPPTPLLPLPVFVSEERFHFPDGVFPQYKQFRAFGRSFDVDEKFVWGVDPETDVRLLLSPGFKEAGRVGVGSPGGVFLPSPGFFVPLSSLTSVYQIGEDQEGDVSSLTYTRGIRMDFHASVGFNRTRKNEGMALALKLDVVVGWEVSFVDGFDTIVVAGDSLRRRTPPTAVPLDYSVTSDSFDLQGFSDRVFHERVWFDAPDDPAMVITGDTSAQLINKRVDPDEDEEEEWQDNW